MGLEPTTSTYQSDVQPAALRHPLTLTLALNSLCTYYRSLFRLMEQTIG